MSHLNQFATIFGVPGFVMRHLAEFVSEGEIQLILCLGNDKLTLPAVAHKLRLSEEKAQELLEQCYRRHLANRETYNGSVFYSAGDFYTLLDYQCKFDEGYHLLDHELLRALDSWCYAVYREKTQPYIEQLAKGETVDRAPETFELIENLGAFIDASSQIRLVPCNCRKLAANCQKPTGTCLAFDSAITDRGFGQALSKEESKSIVKMAHKKGLMHQVNSDWRTKGPAWMCNCCSCCCYPTRLALELGSKGVFPVQQYVAKHDTEKCINCGACAKHCQFKAFAMDDGTQANVVFNRADCWGCGLCADLCPAKAINMVKS